MSGRPRLLDLFCGAGGVGMGYYRAGFDVVGVDLANQPRYPFEFHQGDAMTFPLDGFAAIHASPPCQDYSRAMRHLTGGYPRLIEPVRGRLAAAGVPWVIENVPGAPIPVQPDLLGSCGVELCGTMFGLTLRGLDIYRHRLFETSFPVAAPRGCNHDRHALNPHSVAGRRRITAAFGPGDQERPWREAMGVEWMSREEAREAVPPAFTEYLGRRMLAHLRAAA